jgi:hypothetical protein
MVHIQGTLTPLVRAHAGRTQRHPAYKLNRARFNLKLISGVLQEMMKTTSKLSWWVPLAFQFAEAKREFPRVFPVSVVIRLILAVVVIVALAAHYVPKHIPDLEFDWTTGLLKCLLALALLVASCWVILILPSRVNVTPIGILVSHGQSSVHFPYAELAELRIEDQDTTPTLALRRRDQSSLRRYGISAKINLETLQQTLDAHKLKQ